MKLYIQPATQAMPVATKDFLCQNAASPTQTIGGEVVSGGTEGYNPDGGL